MTTSRSSSIQLWSLKFAFTLDAIEDFEQEEVMVEGSNKCTESSHHMLSP